MMRLSRRFPSLLALIVCAATALSVSLAAAQMPATAPQAGCPGAEACKIDPTQGWARTALSASPRHREYVTVESNGRKITTFVVYPELSRKAPVVVLIHEIFGLSDWFKLQADELAAKGYIVVAPDLLSGMGPDGGGTEALFALTGTNDPVTKAVGKLDPAQVVADLNAVSDYGKKLPSANGKLAVAGFCWGGGKSFEFATKRADLSAAFVFYGPPPPTAAMAAINAPIYGFYGGTDMRIGAMIPQAVTDMKAAGKFYEPVTYEGAGHGFMRAGQAPDASVPNKTAYDQGFARMVKELEKNTNAAAKKKTAMVSRTRKGVVLAKAAAVDCHGMAGM